jgi:hypothetical protein
MKVIPFFCDNHTIRTRSTYMTFSPGICVLMQKKIKKKERFLDYEEYPPSFKLGSPKSAQLVIQNASICFISCSLRYFMMAWL